jgi:hypothetical protein
MTAPDVPRPPARAHGDIHGDIHGDAAGRAGGLDGFNGRDNRTCGTDPAVTGVAYAEATAAAAERPEPYDPLRLCVYATVALIAWLLGPWAVFGFAVLGFVGYLRARRAGLARSRCLLRDTRLVLAYLALIALVAAAAVVSRLLPL